MESYSTRASLIYILPKHLADLQIEIGDVIFSDTCNPFQVVSLQILRHEILRREKIRKPGYVVFLN